ncbi:hypothetical protein KIF59_03365 [Enterobacter cloacae subsp. cloacae]|nr:hypothetical protein [Enterobacter cloacae subsp. cloacae]
MEFQFHIRAGGRNFTGALALSELERVTQSNVAMAEELNGSSDVLRNQVIELQSRTRNFRLDGIRG